MQIPTYNKIVNVFFGCPVIFQKTMDGGTLPQRNLKVEQSNSQQPYSPFDCASITHVGWFGWMLLRSNQCTA